MAAHDHVHKEYWLKKNDKFPWSRKELMFYLWYGAELNEFNIFKEGARYVIMVGSTFYATDLNSITLLSFSEWANLVIKHKKMREQNLEREWKCPNKVS